MCQLLEYKGYPLPKFIQDSCVIVADNSLKSVEELEAQDYEADAAKLQEYIRRGTPADLRRANDLMKKMSGFFPDREKKYVKEQEQMFQHIQDDVFMLIEVLDSIKPGDLPPSSNLRAKTLFSNCLLNQKKLREIISNESDDESLDQLLFLNDILTDAVDKYNRMEAGIYEEAPSPKVEQEINLIDTGAEGAEGQGEENEHPFIQLQGLALEDSKALVPLANSSIQLSSAFSSKIPSDNLINFSAISTSTPMSTAPTNTPTTTILTAPASSSAFTTQFNNSYSLQMSRSAALPPPTQPKKEIDAFEMLESSVKSELLQQYVKKS